MELSVGLFGLVKKSEAPAKNLKLREDNAGTVGAASVLR
jgi:hypothetical protein